MIDTQDLKIIVNTAQSDGLVAATAGGWSFVEPTETETLAAPPSRRAPGVDADVDEGGIAGTATVTSSTTLTDAQQTMVKNAIQKSNEAAPDNPRALVPENAPPVGSAPTDSNTVGSKLSNMGNDILSEITDLGKVGENIAAIHGGSCGGKLHWWGWEAQLDEKGTLALINLLDMQIPKIGLILAAFSAEVPALAAVGAIMGIAGAALGTDIKNGDTNSKGVSLKGYLWIGLSVHALS